MRRGAALILLAVLAACSRGEQASGTAAKEAAAQDDRVRCALRGAKDFVPDCTREVTKGPDGETWIIRHPDGGFRRFVLIDGGKRIATADGADEVEAGRIGPDLEVRVAGERYLFPATPAAPSHAPAS